MVTLTKDERGTVLDTLEHHQREYLQQFLKRGKRTSFSNILAKYKGEGSSNEDLASQWELVDFIDAGLISDEHKCECGRPLRYQYIVKNKITNKILKFGINHFEEHTMIPSNVVKDVIKGWNYIDHELDEILKKFKNNWSLEDAFIFEFPEGVIIPKDIKEHLDLSIPLLNRQVLRLRQIIIETEKPKFQQKEVKVSFENEPIDLFSFGDESNEIINIMEYEMSKRSIYGDPISSNLKTSEVKFIHEYITNNETISAMQICNDLIDVKNSNFGYFSTTGKPKLYIVICNFLDKLVKLERLEFVMDMQRKDRIYKQIQD
ncbi:DUF3895 domain-containing protein [Gottfriedia solisilvae]|uniref:DUF3895 domain-containing protein n=1 Tax=Gottfriedia solisilvae TaxID=1516104 RepID=UPI003D2EEC4E